MIRRPRRIVPATLLALVVLALCTVTAVSVIQELARRALLLPLPAFARHLRVLYTDDIGVVGAGLVAALLGLVLLGCALLPGRAETLALAPQGDAGAGPVTPVAGISRSGLRTALAATLADVDGVTAVRVKVGARRVSAQVRTELTGTEAVRDAVRRAAEQRLDRVGLARTPELRVRAILRQKGAA
jgi:hypothetical protein